VMDECVVTWQFDKTADDLNLVKGEKNFSCEEVVKYPSLSLAAAYSMLMCKILILAEPRMT
jgi:hypothetical protein